MWKGNEPLLSRLSHRNWMVWFVLLGLSLLWRSTGVFLGIAAGGLVAIGGFYWLHHSLVGTLTKNPSCPAARFMYPALLRLAVVVGMTALLIASGRVSSAALAVGLSVVVINLLLLALQSLLKGGLEG